MNSVVREITGTNSVESVEIENLETGKKETEPCGGVFIFVGTIPNTQFLCNVYPEQCGGQIGGDARA